MELSILQSLTKRQGNYIAGIEQDIVMLFDYAKCARMRTDAHYLDAEEFVQKAHQLKRKLKNLVYLQKALKKEIASKVHCNRHYDSLTHPDDIFGETFGDMFGKSFFNFSLKDIFKK